MAGSKKNGRSQNRNRRENRRRHAQRDEDNMVMIYMIDLIICQLVSKYVILNAGMSHLFNSYLV